MRPVRRDDATHPRELPDPADEAVFYAALDPTRSVTPTTWQEGDPCELCNEDGTDDDPLGHFQHAVRPGDYVMAHGQCGEDDGLRLA